MDVQVTIMKIARGYSVYHNHHVACVHIAVQQTVDWLIGFNMAFDS